MGNGSKARQTPLDVLVFFPTYNEVGNVRRLIEGIHAELPTAGVLVVDDASPDGTGELLEELLLDDPLLRIIHRPRKLGVGSAHKLALFYARESECRRFVSMDADFSHHPRYLNTMLTRLDSAEFVTGSRYIEGGRCDYGLRRQLISRAANAIARIVLGLGLAENTTLYRGFTRGLLSGLDIDRIRSDGYSFAVESLYEVSRVTRNLAEFPIHFEDRVAGNSKISKSEIFKAILTLMRLGFIRFNPFGRKNAPVQTVRPSKATICVGCGSAYQIEKYPARMAEAKGSKRAHWWRSAPVRDSAADSYASHDSRTYGRTLQCLQCGLVFIEPGVEERELVEPSSEQGSSQRGG